MSAKPFQALRKCLVAAVAAMAGLLLVSQVQAAGLLSPADGSAPPLELRDHQVRVVVEDGYAVTTIEQVFANPHGRDFEARYSFPVPEKAAVASFSYWIDGKEVIGEVLPKAEARQVYQEEQAAGREAALAEQDSHKTFDMTVWPVPAGGEVRIALSYIQAAKVDTGIGRFVYPLAEGGVDEDKLAFWTANEVVTGRFSFDLELKAATPIAALRLPAHPQAQVTQAGPGHWLVHMDNGVPVAAAQEEAGAAVQQVAVTPATRLDQDIVVYWRLTEGLPASVELVAHKPAGAQRGTFMLVVTPGDDLAPITEGRDWTFVLDKSGSMSGKWHSLAEGVRLGLLELRPEDRFRIFAFDNAAYTLTEGYKPATPAQIQQALDSVRRLQSGGGTNLYAGLNIGSHGNDADRTAALFLVTDGVANVGEIRHRAFLDLVRQQDLRLFTFVMGNSANRPLLEAMTRESGGTAISVSTSDDIAGAVLTAQSKVGHQALHDVALTIEGLRTGDLAPSRIGSLYGGQQLVLFGHYWGDGPGRGHAHRQGLRPAGHLSHHLRLPGGRRGQPRGRAPLGLRGDRGAASGDRGLRRHRRPGAGRRRSGGRARPGHAFDLHGGAARGRLRRARHRPRQPGPGRRGAGRPGRTPGPAGGQSSGRPGPAHDAKPAPELQRRRRWRGRRDRAVRRLPRGAAGAGRLQGPQAVSLATSLANSSRGAMSVPWLTFCLGLGAAALFALFGPAPEAWLYDRAAIEGGELWRLVTGHLVHSDRVHLAWNLGALLLLGGLAEMRLGARALIGPLVLGVLAIDAWLWWAEPELLRYCGLSGLLNGLFVALALGLWRQSGSRLFLLLAAGDLAKIALEVHLGGALLPTTGALWGPVPGAHLAGFAAGLAAALIPGFHSD